MVGRVHASSPRVRFASRGRDFSVPRSFLVCVLSLLLTLIVDEALEPNKRLTQYAHTVWRIQDGFLPNTPFRISQTKDGYLWVAGHSGAWRFDGVRFAPWSAPISFTPKHIVSVRAGEFWIASEIEVANVRGNCVIPRY